MSREPTCQVASCSGSLSCRLEYSLHVDNCHCNGEEESFGRSGKAPRMNSDFRPRHSAGLLITGSPNNLADVASRHNAQMQERPGETTIIFSESLKNEVLKLGTGNHAVVHADKPSARHKITIVVPEITDCSIESTAAVDIVVTCRKVTRCKFSGQIADEHHELRNTNSSNPSVVFTESEGFLHGLQFTGVFFRLIFPKNTRIDGCKAITAGVERFTASNCLFTKSDFRFFCQGFDSPACEFRDCVWLPELLDVNLDGTRFPGSVVRLGSWIESSAAKTTADFQSAKKLVDDWIDLRDEFTGIRLYKILILTAAFFSPIILKTALLLGFAHAIPEAIIHYEQTPVWHLLLFGDKSGRGAYAHLFFFSLLAIFNLLRLFVTLEVSRLRDREDYLIAAGFTRTRPRFEPIVKRGRLRGRYEVPPRLLRMAAWVRRLYYLAIAYAVWEVITILFEQVPLVRTISF